MIIAIHQPQYMPWLGYFDKIDRADGFCILDNVQYKKNEWQNRNRIRTVKSWQWMTVPVTYRFPQKIDEVWINNNVNWRHKHLQAITTNYRKAPYFERYFPVIESVLSSEWKTIVDLNIHLINLFRRWLGLDDRPITRASEMQLSDDPTGRLIDICRQMGGDVYLAGADGMKYMDVAQFKDVGIVLKTQAFTHPEYPQCFPGFESHMSVLDLLFNCGPDSLDIIRSTRV